MIWVNHPSKMHDMIQSAHKNMSDNKTTQTLINYTINNSIISISKPLFFSNKTYAYLLLEP